MAIPGTGLAQAPGDRMSKDDLDLEYLEKLVKDKIDSVRQKKKLDKLTFDPILYKAARDHAEYLVNKKKNSHFQTSRNKKTPQDRVDFYGAKDYLVGENIASTYILVPTLYKYQSKNAKPRIDETYEQAADAMVKGWIKSPPHYANIKTKEYKLTAVAIAFNKVSSNLKGVQVFAYRR